MLKSIVLVVLLLFSGVSYSERNPYSISTAHKLATKAGEDILKQGGNAFDAAVAISAALAVVEPYGSGIGGGGFWLLHSADSNIDIMIDGRETAPINSTADMYLDDQGNITKDSIDGPLAAGIPGVIAALEVISEDYGNLSFKQNLDPAIHLARNGFNPGLIYTRLAKFRKQALLASPSAANIFLHQGKVPGADSVIIQSDLANTLERIARFGGKEFYQGETAKKLVEGVRAAGGIWQLKDLQQYQVIKRKPIVTTYKNLELILPPPPTSG
ncbi:MAG: gamma-glutamyltransferase, partial [Pseudomonadota bacterium]